MKNPYNVMSIDVEDYYHILDVKGSPNPLEWDSLNSTVEDNFIKLLDIMEKHNIKTTCFFLGYIAKRFPHLIKKAFQQGHEIASHGFYHQEITKISKNAFISDISDSKNLIEDIAGSEVYGYRAPGFSVLENNPYFFEELINAGYKYDASIFPAKHGHGGYNINNTQPHLINTKNGAIFEFPVSVAEIMGKRICFFGGGYLRFFPNCVINHMKRSLNNQGDSIIFYIHPREIDPCHPRIEMNFKRHFKSYFNLKSVPKKLDMILSSNNFITMKKYMEIKGSK